MRVRPARVLAVLLAVGVFALAAAPHVHAQRDAHECVACATTVAGAAPASAPDVAPLVFVESRVELAPGLAPVAGFPLGAVPGQSPPQFA